MRAMPRWFWILIGLAVASAMGAVLVFLYTHPAAAAVLRDILIIALAMQLTLLAAVTTFLIRLVDWLQEEVRPILGRAQETVNTVHGTSAFLSRRLARPAIEAASMAAGVAYALRTFVRLLRGRAS
jgi:Mg2+/Co2+ transporter CorB